MLVTCAKITVLATLLIAAVAIDGSLAETGGVLDATTGLRTAVLPLKDYTDNSNAQEPIVNAIYTSLAERGIEFVAPEELRPILRRNRIRAAGSVSPSDAAAIGRAVGVDILLVGSIDFYRDAQNLECGLSLRLVSPSSMTILSSVSLAATAQGQIGLFGTGAPDSISDLIPMVAEKIIGELYAPLLNPGQDKPNANAAIRTVVLPFENISKDRHAGKIAANWLLSELVGAGYSVIEPGAVIDLTLPNGGSPVGEIDYPRLQLVREKLSADVVVTGEVDRFRSARSLSLASKPELEFGLRLTDAATGVVAAIHNAEHDGGESETIFGLGRCHSLGLLLQSALKNALHRLQPTLTNYASAKP